MLDPDPYIIFIPGDVSWGFTGSEARDSNQSHPECLEGRMIVD